MWALIYPLCFLYFNKTIDIYMSIHIKWAKNFSFSTSKTYFIYFTTSLYEILNINSFIWRKPYFCSYIFMWFLLWSLTFICTAFSPYLGKHISFLSLLLHQRWKLQRWQTECIVGTLKADMTIKIIIKKCYLALKNATSTSKLKSKNHMNWDLSMSWTRTIRTQTQI